jgi:DNA/RNA endonuclease YhcR with UshA esterase domain
MRALAFVLVPGLMLAAASANAQTVAPNEARDHVGQNVTVEGAVSDVDHAASRSATFIDMGGHYPNNTFAAVIFKDDADKFPDVDTLNGKTIDVTGLIRLYQGRAEIILNDPAQIKSK